ncbi:hypothetical protein Y11_11431 [Yersinia enterocolitica subsp. palearctica Y11]|uniref:Uncharacterized protein n=1 Tax=Yersinia enterocolitica subsp. palearctica serotype O:3 (strain DSM 13030 / CIP 106945 / Y11) TaxID=930944 RepID=A0A0H3NPL4_YERE1|nr:hypothetical protein Y11_11431 [Yersinia enterocolitica subsp. palearctica Y11]CCO68480.1 hypothetical protein D322_1606 [Yersinia enterocolitica IP 10393]
MAILYVNEYPSSFKIEALHHGNRGCFLLAEVIISKEI